MTELNIDSFLTDIYFRIFRSVKECERLQILKDATSDRLHQAQSAKGDGLREALSDYMTRTYDKKN